MYEDLAKDYDLDEVSLEILKGLGSKSQALKYIKRFPKKTVKAVPKATPKVVPKPVKAEEEE